MDMKKITESIVFGGLALLMDKRMEAGLAKGRAEDWEERVCGNLHPLNVERIANAIRSNLAYAVYGAMPKGHVAGFSKSVADIMNYCVMLTIMMDNMAEERRMGDELAAELEAFVTDYKDEAVEYEMIIQVRAEDDGSVIESTTAKVAGFVVEALAEMNGLLKKRYK